MDILRQLRKDDGVDAVIQHFSSVLGAKTAQEIDDRAAIQKALRSKKNQDSVVKKFFDFFCRLMSLTSGICAVDAF